MSLRSARRSVAAVLAGTWLAISVAGCSAAEDRAPDGGPDRTTSQPVTHGFVRTGTGPVGLAADGRGRVWVADADAGTLARLAVPGPSTDLRTRVGQAPLRLAASRGALWASVFRDGTLVRVDPRTGKVTARLRVGPSPEGVAVVGGSVWVVLEEPAQLVQVDLATSHPVRRIRHVGQGPRLVTAGLGSLWVSDFATGSVVRLDPRTGRTRRSAQVCEGPQGMALSRDRLWVACTTGEQLVAVDPGTLRVTSRTRLRGEPDAVAVDARGRVVVVLQDGPAVAVVDPGSARKPARVARRIVLGHAGRLYDRANVDLLLRGERALVSSYLEGGVYTVRLR